MPKNRLMRALDSRRTARAAVTNVTGGTTTVTLDHGTLTGLADDDHTQYLNTTRGDARYVPLTRTVTAGNGLTGGGALSGNLTLNVGAGAGITVNADDVALASSVAGNGLRYTTGQLSIDAGTLITVGTTSVGLSNGTAQYQIPVTGGTPFTPAYTALSTYAGPGLTFTAGQFAVNSGGGLIINGDDVAVGAGAGITINANDVALTTPGTLTHNSASSSTGSHTHAITSSDNVNSSTTALLKATNGALTLDSLTATTRLRATRLDTSLSSMTLAPTNDLILDPGGKDVVPNTTLDIDLGSITKKFLTLHAAELMVETLVAQDTIATIGGRILVGPTTSLVRNLGSNPSTDTTIYVKHNNLASGDRVYLEANGNVEIMAVTSGFTSQTDGYSYTVTRDLDGSGTTLWYAGDAVFNTGTTGDGFIDIYSIRSIKRRIAGSGNNEEGPTIVGNVRTGTGYNAWEPRWAIGNLNALYGYSSTNVYGFAAGDPNNTWISADATNGFRVMFGNTAKISLDTSGNASFAGEITATTGTIGGWGLLSDAIYSNNIAMYSGATNTARLQVGNTGYIAGISSAGATGDVTFWAGAAHGNRATAPFNVTAGGKLTATGVDVTGTVTATDGAIGGWTLGASTLTGGNITLESSGTTSNIRVGTGSSSAGIANAPSAGNVAFWAGSTFTNRGSAAFQVTNSGVLTASGATISGALTATSGSFTGVVTVGTGGRLEAKDGATTAAYMDSTGLSIIEGNAINWRSSVGSSSVGGKISSVTGLVNQLSMDNGTAYVRVASSSTVYNRVEMGSSAPGTAGVNVLVTGKLEVAGALETTGGGTITSSGNVTISKATPKLTLTSSGAGNFPAIQLDNSDNGTTVGARLFLGRNTNASSAAGHIYWVDKGGTQWRVWPEDNGTLRIWDGGDPTSGNDQQGVAIGSQTSHESYKSVLEGETPIADVMARLAAAAVHVHKFEYLPESCAPTGEIFEGLVLQENAPETHYYGMDKSCEGYSAGKSLNLINLCGDLMRAVVYLQERVEALH